MLDHACSEGEQLALRGHQVLHILWLKRVQIQHAVDWQRYRFRSRHRVIQCDTDFDTTLPIPGDQQNRYWLQHQQCGPT